jgi:hypothetical protein
LQLLHLCLIILLQNNFSGKFTIKEFIIPAQNKIPIF